MIKIAYKPLALTAIRDIALSVTLVIVSLTAFVAVTACKKHEPQAAAEPVTFRVLSEEEMMENRIKDWWHGSYCTQAAIKGKPGSVRDICADTPEAMAERADDACIRYSLCRLDEAAWEGMETEPVSVVEFELSEPS